MNDEQNPIDRYYAEQVLSAVADARREKAAQAELVRKAAAYDALAARLAEAEALVGEVARNPPVTTIDGGLWWQCAWCQHLYPDKRIGGGPEHKADCLYARIAAWQAHTAAEPGAGGAE